MDRFAPYTFVASALLCITACQQPFNPTIRTNGTLTLIDSTAEPTRYATLNDDNFDWFPIFYIGMKADTLRLGPQPIPIYDRDKDAARQSITHFGLSDSSTMQIVVDTTLTLPFTAFHYDENGEELPDSTKYYRSVTVLAYNLSDKPLFITDFSTLRYVTRQVKDTLGHWVDIQQESPDYCGTGSQPKYLEPGQILVAKACLHKGNLKTQCRLKFQYGPRPVYSNPYTDYINSH